MRKYLDDAFSGDVNELLKRLLVVVLILLVTWLIRRVFINWILPRIGDLMVRRTRTTYDEELLRIFQPPLRNLISLLGLWAALIALDMPTRVNKVIGRTMMSVAAIIIFWGLYRSIDLLVRIIRRLNQRKEGQIVVNVLDEKLLLVVQQVGKALIFVMAFTVVMDQWGYSIAGMMAGLGLGGLAVALAAQDALANLIGYFVILADEPFEVGEYVAIGDLGGTVENVGFRSTRIRVLDQSLVIVPNKTVVNSNLVNWSRLNKRRLNMKLSLPHDTQTQRVLLMVQAIREMLRAHPLVQPDSVIVQFTDLNSTSLELTIICFMKTPGWADFQAARQDINLRILKILERIESIGAAVPTLQMEPEAADSRPLPKPKPEPALGTVTDSPVPDDAAN